MRNRFFWLASLFLFLLLISSLLIVTVVKGSSAGSYLLFDGNSGYIEVPDSDAYSVTTTGALTVSFWMRPDALDFPTTIASGDGAYINFLGKGEFLSPTNWEWNFRLYNYTNSARPNRVSFYLFDLGGGTGVGSYFQGGIVGTPMMVAGEWVHVVGKIDSTKTYIYRNGVLRDSDVWSATITPQNGVAPLRIGTVSTITFSPFLGAMDDVCIWNRALSDAEITALYQGTVPENGLVGRWMFDEGAGNTVVDGISHNNGSLIPGSGYPSWASSVNTVTSETFTVNNVGETTGYITNVPFGVSKADFQTGLTKGQIGQTWDVIGLSDPVVSGDILVVTSQDGLAVRTYTVTVETNPDIALVAADKTELVAGLIKGSNVDLDNVTVALTNPLPSSGSNGSTITWASNNTGVVSNDGQTVTRPAYGNSNAVVTLTATITKGAVSETKDFSLTVLAETVNPDIAKAITAFNFSVGSVGVINGTDIVINVPYGTNVTALVPTITITGDSISPNTGVARDFTSPVTYTVTARDSSTQIYTVAVNVVRASQTVPNTNGEVTVSNNTPEVVVNSPTQVLTVTAAAGTTDASINFDELITGGTGIIPETTINTDEADVVIPASTTVTSADSSWNGAIKMPSATTVTLPETSGETKTLSMAIELGFVDAKLTFNKGVRILLRNQKDKRVGYFSTSGEFTEITGICASDTQSVGNALAASGECKITVGDDLVVWTKHFTKYVTYTQTTNTSNVVSTTTNTTNSNSGSGSSSFCGDQKPVLTPDLFQINTSRTTAKLFFTPIANNRYYISFSTRPDAEEHGEGVTLLSEGVQSHTIFMLKPNTTYYFKVRGQNGCMPGDWSNIMKIKTNSGIYFKSKLTTISSGVKSTLNLIKSSLKNVSNIKSTPENTFSEKNDKQVLIPTPTPAPKVVTETKKRCFLWWCW